VRTTDNYQLNKEESIISREEISGKYRKLPKSQVKSFHTSYQNLSDAQQLNKTFSLL